MPIPFRFSLALATRVVPEPQNGSRTTIFSLVKNLINFRVSLIKKGAGCWNANLSSPFFSLIQILLVSNNHSLPDKSLRALRLSYFSFLCGFFFGIILFQIIQIILLDCLVALV